MGAYREQKAKQRVCKEMRGKKEIIAMFLECLYARQGQAAHPPLIPHPLPVRFLPLRTKHLLRSLSFVALEVL